MLISLNPKKIELFWRKVDKRTSHECWRWLAAFNKKTPVFGVGGKKVSNASRVAYTISKGPIPEDSLVRHTCDNPACVNPAHLLLGTQQQNIQDARSRKRINPNKSGRILDEATVLQMRRQYSKGKSTWKLASLFQISHAAVQKVVTGQSYREFGGTIHVPTKSRSSLPLEAISKAYDDGRAGLSQHQVARQFGVDRKSVRRAMILYPR